MQQALLSQYLNNIATKLPDFKKKQLVLNGSNFANCPLGLIELKTTFGKAEKYNTDQSSKDFKATFIKLVLDAHSIVNKYKSLTTSEHLSKLKILDSVYDIANRIKNKMQQSHDDGKKLLVVLGETHLDNKALLYELIILTIVKTLGFDALLHESDPFTLQQSKAVPLPFVVSTFASDVLNMKIMPCDTQTRDPDQLIHEGRNEIINHQISLKAFNDQILIIGSFHLKHIIESPEINNKFNILPINLSDNSLKEYFDFANTFLPIDWSDEIYPSLPINDEAKLNFNLESFSTAKIFSIYETILPNLFTDSKEVIDEVFISEPNEFQQCKFWIKEMEENIPNMKYLVETGPKIIGTIHEEL